MLGFINEMSTDFVDYDTLVPKVRVKYKDMLCFSGKKVEYKDFTKMVFRDNRYVPYMFAGGIKKEDKVIDFISFYCIGMSELLGHVSDVGSCALTALRWRVTTALNIGITDAIKLGRTFNNITECAEDPVFGSLLSARTRYKGYSWESVRQTVCMLYVAYKADPKVFCEAMLEVMQFTYTYSTVFCSDDDSVTVGAYEQGVYDQDCKKSFTNKHAMQFGVSVNPITKTRITDSRGIGIYSFLLLNYMLFHEYGECLNSYTLNLTDEYDSCLDFIQERLSACTGKDDIGKYLRGRDCSFNIHIDEPESVMSVNANFINFSDKAFSADKMIKANEVGTVTADFLDDMFLFYNTLCDKVTSIEDIGNRNVNMHYVNEESLCSCLMTVMCYMETDDVLESLNDLILLKAIQISSKQPTDYDDIKKELSSCKAKLQNTEESLKSLQAKYEKDTKSLEMQLSRKADNIEKLNDKVLGLKDELSKFFVDKDFEEDEEVDDTSNETIEEMVAFLNDFKFAMIGGRENLDLLLADLGFTNVVHVSDNGDIASRRTAVDFIIINASLVSHRLVYKVRSEYIHQLDTIFYYNGTNVENLIRACYKYVTEYLS